MLRNRSRAVTSKQPLMADHHHHQTSSQSSPTQKKIPSFFGSPRFRAFTMKGNSETESLMSPTSILDTKPLPFTSPFSYDKTQPISPQAASPKKHLWEKPEAKGIGLALLHSINDEKIEEAESNASKPNNGKVLFGTKLRVQIPPCPSKPPIQTEVLNSPQVLSEMELSEDYTCVISRGPNPRTTHIFDNCIVERYYKLSDHSNSASANFLSFCFTCKKNLEQKIDIYIYRGEKAFCSRECRYQEMVLDEVGNEREF